MRWLTDHRSTPAGTGLSLRRKIVVDDRPAEAPGGPADVVGRSKNRLKASEAAIDKRDSLGR